MGKAKVTNAQRSEIIGLWRAGAFSKRKIGGIVRVSEKCVRTTIKNFEASGAALEATRSGRPRKLTDRQERYIFRKARVNYKWSFRDLANDFNQNCSSISVSRYTVRRILLRFKIESHLAVRKPLLTVGDRLKRLNWARRHQYWTFEDWANVIFSDESNFELNNRKGRIHVKRLREEKYLPRFIHPRLQGGGGSAGIWGCISHKGTGVCNLYTGRINQYNYINCLDNCLLPSGDLFYQHKNYLFMQDGAPAHTANSVKDYFRTNDMRLLDWYARSPDLNPIENVWACMDRQMSRISITSIEHLKEVLNKIWLEVPRYMCMRLIE